MAQTAPIPTARRKPKRGDTEEPAAPIREVPGWKDLPLWPHQVRAIEIIHQYLAQSMDSAALIQLPTGTGKTGIMAVVAGCRNETDDVLIVGPWKQLARQICRELIFRFWEKLGAAPAGRRSDIQVFTPKLARTLLRASTRRRVLICTYQTLTAVMTSPALKKALRERVGIVLADEGHREPAPMWSKAVRGLNRPTVLFTATPYRNDFRTFTVADHYAVQMSFDDAVRGRFIRDVRFEERIYGGDVETFCERFATFFLRQLPRRKPSTVAEPRAIVRCASEANVAKVAAGLRQRLGAGEVVAIHERLTDRGSELDRTDVPDPEDVKARVWVHQNKLIEGIDDPAFCCVAFFEPFGDHRSLIQQIGRVIRNPRRDPDQWACVFSDPTFALPRAWENYRDYDRKNPQPWRDIENYNRIVAQHVAKLYIGRHFREIFDPKAPDFHLELRYHRSGRVYQLRRGMKFDFDRYLDWFDHILNERRCQMLNHAQPNEDTVVVLYQDLQPSRHLLSKSFPEARLGFAVTRVLPPYVVHYDTSAIIPGYLSLVATPIDTDALERLVNVKGAKVTQVSLVNGDLGLFAARRRSLAASGLANVPPALNDSMFAVSTTVGYRQDVLPAVDDKNGSSSRRSLQTRWYVGFENATITQSTPSYFTFANFLEWTEWLVETLGRRRVQFDGQLNRFARYVRAPRHPHAAHILFDTGDMEELFGQPPPENPKYHGLHIEDRASEIKKGKFSIVVNGRSVEGNIQWDGAAFEVDCPVLAQSYVSGTAVGNRRADFLSRLNHEQAFRIITDEGLLYTRGRFARPRASLWGQDCAEEAKISHVITSVAALNGLSGEKEGEASRKKDRWDDDSVFARIDDGSLFAEANFAPEVLVCEDMGTETADFIALRLTPPRSVVIVHAKYAKGRKGAAPPRLSAAAFHTVCGQVQKNLNFLVPDAEPPSGERWNGQWNGGDGYVVDRRIRLSPPGFDGPRIAQEITRLVRSPEATREVWIVSGAGLSRESLVEQEKLELPRSEAMQLIYLLHGTWNLVSMWGAKMRVFCPIVPPIKKLASAKAARVGGG